MIAGVIAMTSVQGPVRTCVGCRQRCPADELLRLVLGAGRAVVPDPARRLPGRGAHLHPSHRCLEEALRRRALARALRAPVEDVSALARWLDELSDSSVGDEADSEVAEGLDSLGNTNRS